jgi:hypothetical protein
MSETNRSIEEQLNFAGENDNIADTTTVGNSASNPQDTVGTSTPWGGTNDPLNGTADATANNNSDTMKRRGFFEAIKHNGCAQDHLANLLKEHEIRAAEKIKQADALAEQEAYNLRQRIARTYNRITELKEKIQLAVAYKESEDEELKTLIAERDVEENLLQDLQQKLTEVRKKLGEAKAGIVNKSLEDAEQQVKAALNIQKNIYDETKLLNQQKFDDEKEHLTQLAECYQELYAAYEKRYKRVDKYLTVLDVDGISPITTQILTTVGTVSFGAAGFFFSTFAGNAGFGNRDVLYFVMGGIFDTANQSIPGWAKLLIFLGLILLVTAVSVGCNYLITQLKKNSELDEVQSEVSLGAAISKKLRQVEYHASVKSNNWYGFWLQLIPGILIAGLIVLGIARKATDESIGAINASSEGLVIGSCIAMAVAGLIYLYIIKIVEPRLVKRYEDNANTSINWIRANWELVIILTVFLLFVVAVVLVPYNITSSGFGILPVGHRTRYAILLFAAICLVGGISFAYSVRSRGLIETGRYLERVMRRLKSIIAHCNGPVAPELHNEVAGEHSNIIQHVLKQLSFNATLNKEEAYLRSKLNREKSRSWIERLLGIGKETDETQPQEPMQIVTVIQPWEEHYFPHIIDELRAVEFEYREQKARAVKYAAAVEDYRTIKQSQVSALESEVQKCYSDIVQMETDKEAVIKNKGIRHQNINNTYNKVIVDLLDGFHLGLWYRENGLGPTSDFFEPCTPVLPRPIALISAH